MLGNHALSDFFLFLYYRKLSRIQGDLINYFINDINELNNYFCSQFS